MDLPQLDACKVYTPREGSSPVLSVARMDAVGGTVRSMMANVRGSGIEDGFGPTRCMGKNCALR